LNVHYGQPSMVPPAPVEAKPRRLRVTLIVIGALALLAAVTWAAGGMRPRSAGPVRTVAGRTVNQGLYDVQVLDARSGRIKPDSYSPPANLLLVRMRVTDLGDKSYGVGSFIEGVAVELSPGKYLPADFVNSSGYVYGQKTTEIHPRLPVEVTVVWQLGTATVPRTVPVALKLWEYDQSFTTDEFNWSVTKQSPIKAKVSVPVRLGATS
jgi:hypothetical protein